MEGAEPMGRFGDDLRLFLRMRPLVGNREWARTLAAHYRRPSSFPWYQSVKAHVEGTSGLEVGGPSAIFGPRGSVPVYPYLTSWDNVNFAPRTLWSNVGRVQNGRIFNGSHWGRQLVAEASRLDSIESESYGAVLNSHVIEHLANPIRALREWKRVLRPKGRIVVVVPEGSRTFDHARKPTPVAHLLDDFQNDVEEDDLGHVPEVLAAHDITMDPGVRDQDSLAVRSRRNFEVRALHHHVFTIQSLPVLLEHAGFAVGSVARVSPNHLLAEGERMAG
ncbi:MAG: class I SAM-dependent methyltransferase [Thermoplasmata archaeon]|nr:class I SAM-dependent methyltransferase [Thermoplasmata archaeon]